jgi:3-oxoadipate enol-lactonase
MSQVPVVLVPGLLCSPRLTTPDHAAEIAERIAGARLAIVPDCGHLSALEQPAAIGRELAAWLSP